MVQPKVATVNRPTMPRLPAFCIRKRRNALTVLLLGFEHVLINLDTRFGALLGGIRYYVALAIEAC
jgi:hypothetical protein